MTEIRAGTVLPAKRTPVTLRTCDGRGWSGNSPGKLNGRASFATVPAKEAGRVPGLGSTLRATLYLFDKRPPSGGRKAEGGHGDVLAIAHSDSAVCEMRDLHAVPIRGAIGAFSPRSVTGTNRTHHCPPGKSALNVFLLGWIPLLPGPAGSREHGP